MRFGSVALLVSVAMGVAALAAAAGSAGVGSMDSGSMIPGESLGRTFAGSQPAGLPSSGLSNSALPTGLTDPDLPISTARYGDDHPSPLAAPVASVMKTGPSPQAYAQVAAAPSPASGPAPIKQIAQAPEIELAGARSLAGGPVGDFDDDISLAVAHGRSPLGISFGSGPASDWGFAAPPVTGRAQPLAANPAAPHAPRAEKLIDGRAILLRIGPTRRDARRGRWFLFAAGSGKAFGLNLIRDPVQGWRRAGWSMEKVAEFGKVQLGLGWRKGPTQVSAAVSRREIGAYGYSRNDTVVGVSFSIRPNKPGKK